MAILDTSFLIDLQNQEEYAIATLERLKTDGDRLHVAAQAAIEYLAGLQDPMAGMRKLEESFHLVLVDRETIIEAARISRDARGRGKTAPWTDVQIAATALLGDDTVVTSDEAVFESLGCRVINHRRTPTH